MLDYGRLLIYRVNISINIYTVTVPHKMVGLRECRILKVSDYRGSTVCTYLKGTVLNCTLHSNQNLIYTVLGNSVPMIYRTDDMYHP